MKTKLSILTVFILTAFSLQAQLKYSIGAGLNYGNYKFKNVANVTNYPKAGLYFSFAPKYQINNKFSTQVDFQYSSEGYIQSESNLVYKFNFLRFNPQLEYKLFRNLGLLIGPNIGYKINEQFQNNDGIWHRNKIYDDVKNWDFSATIGVKFYVKKFYFILKYNHGLNNVSNYYLTDTQGNILKTKETHRNLQIGVGFTF